eukprot:gnl/MRDRNA2_/MRDRNA2_47500_c0_seq1.p1 gnl/MRDRNA2_/MRDRNA2_47500_c0~~gnl/MRDRNA2_/MRDRNA2_47500_c0_seq1.p1  ORF type:complete len:127 (-),score=16.00 gnl/MRDRNA2_/MRDRNA2_47500_c0_seq1:45-425(-)
MRGLGVSLLVSWLTILVSPCSAKSGRLRRPWTFAYSQHIFSRGGNDPKYDHDEYNKDEYPGWRNEYPYNETKEKQPGYPEESKGKHHHPEYSEKWEDKEEKAQKSASTMLTVTATLAGMLLFLSSR